MEFDQDMHVPENLTEVTANGVLVEVERDEATLGELLQDIEFSWEIASF